MSTVKYSETVRINVDNCNLLSDLLREHNELETELKKIDSNLRKIGTISRLRKSSLAIDNNDIDLVVDDKQKRSNRANEQSGPSINQPTSPREKYNNNKRKNYDNTTDNESANGDYDDFYGATRQCESSHHVRPVKPAILSSVVTLPTSQQDVSKQRIEAMEVQKSDKKGLARNKRMFGMILGTLEKFQSEESYRSETTQKRSKIEKKLEIAVEEERAVAKEERDKLIVNKRIKQEQLDKLDLKLDKVQRHENWELSHRHLGNFIKTDVKPCIFWLPRSHTAETEKKLRDSRDYYKLYVAERRAKVKKELEYMDKQFQTCDGDQSAKIALVEESNSKNDEIGLNGSNEEALQVKKMDIQEVVVEHTSAPSIIGLEEFEDGEFL